MTDRRNALVAGLTLAVAPAIPLAASTPGMPGSITANEYWADKNGVKLWVYRKRQGGVQSRGSLFLRPRLLVLGKTMFDLQVPDRDDYSMMDHFARLGYDVWTMDHEGYGHSDKTAANSDIQSGVEDLAAAMKVIQRKRAARARVLRPIVGRAARRALRQPASGDVEKLALDAFVYTGKDAPTLAERRKNLPRYQARTAVP
jgi:hypothetical protein